MYIIIFNVVIQIKLYSIHSNAHSVMPSLIMLMVKMATLTMLTLKVDDDDDDDDDDDGGVIIMITPC